MIRIKLEGREQEISYEEFIRAIQEGRITAETPVYSEVLTSGSWRPAARLQLFRVWAPEGSLPVEEPPPSSISTPTTAESAEPPPPTVHPSPEPPATEPIEGSATASDPIPWEMMDRIGFAGALIWTVSLAFRSVEEFFDRIGRGNALIPALTFGLLIFAVAAVFKAAYDALFISRFGEVLEEFSRNLPGMTGEEFGPTGARDAIFLYGLQILLYPAFSFLWSGLLHLFLRMTGRGEGGFAGTFRVANYAAAPLLLTIFPFCGNVVGGIWSLVLTIRGLSRVHRIEGIYAALAVLIPLVVLLCVYSATIFGSVMQAMPSLGEGLPS